MEGKQSNSGRKIGSTNKLTPEAKEALYDVLESDFKRLEKLISTASFDERVIHLKYFAKLLAVGNDEVAQKTREVMFEGLEEHFKKMRFYFPHLPQNKKAIELRQFLMLQPSERIEEVFKGWTRSN
jgi:hypothetical protein